MTGEAIREAAIIVPPAAGRRGDLAVTKIKGLVFPARSAPDADLPVRGVQRISFAPRSVFFLAWTVQGSRSLKDDHA